MTIRIKGLVGAYNDVQARLQAGTRPVDAESFHNYVRGIVQQVEAICSALGAKPGDLPLTSPMAYESLREIQTARLPSPRKNTTSRRPPELRVPNVVKNAGLFSKRMWIDLPTLLESPAAKDNLRSQMLEFAYGIEESCAQHDFSLTSMASPSRRAYSWAKFILTKGNLDLHLSALSRGRQALETITSDPRQVELHIANMNSIWRRRHRSQLAVLKVNEGFVHADEKVWQALIRSSVSKGNRECRGIVNEYIESEEFSGVLFEMESFARPRHESTVGRVHSLDQSFDRVNATYFSGSVPKPHLAWNTVITSRKFGHYEFARDTVMLSISLDDSAVPEELVDYVMYHELLHKKHGVKLTNGRRMAHTSAFRKDEKRFLGHEDAVAKLNNLARRHSSR